MALLPMVIRAMPTPITQTPRVRILGAGLFLALTACIGVLGWRYQRSEQLSFEHSVEDQLSAIADLKTRQIVKWRAECLDDARAIKDQPFLAQHIASFLNRPDDHETRTLLQSWLESSLEHNQCGRVILLDSNLNVRLTFPEDQTNFGPIAQGFAQEALHSNQVVISELHPSRYTGAIHFDLAIPLSVPTVAGDSARGEVPQLPAAPIAVVDFEVDPSRFLYPLIQKWPTPSPTAETLLVRVEDGQVLFLNELRHRPNTALRLRIPLTQTNTPAVQAVLGREGIVQGDDYRGVVVFAVIRKVPNSSWYLVAKMDREEVLAPLRTRSRLILVSIIFSILAAGLGLWLVLRWHTALDLDRQLATEKERSLLTERLTQINRQAHDSILLFDHRRQVLDANDQALATYGYSLAEFRGLEMQELRPAETVDELAPLLARLETEKGLLYETRHRRKNGTELPVEVSLRLVELQGDRFYQAVLRDITERKQGEEVLRQRVKLQDQLTRTAATLPGMIYSFQLHPDGSIQMPYASGALSDLFDLQPEDVIKDAAPIFSRIHPDDIEHVQATIAESARTLNPWREDFRVCQTRLGEIWVEANSAPQREPDGSILWHGFLQNVTERKRSEQALVEIESRLNHAMSLAQLGAWEYDVASGHFTFSDLYYALHGTTAELEGGNLMSAEDFARKFIHPNDAHLVAEEVGRAVAATGPDYQRQLECRIVCRDGELRYVRVHIAITQDAAGRTIQLHGANQDITEQKRAEIATSRLAAIIESSDDAIIGKDLNGLITSWNSGAEKMFGYTSAEMVGSSILRLVPAERQPEERQILEKIKRGECVTHFETVRRAKRDRLIDVSLTASPIKDRAGNLVGVSKLARDITERKRADEALRRSAQLLQMILDTIPNPVFYQDAQGLCQGCNQAFEKFFGRAKPEIVGHSLDPLLPFSQIGKSPPSEVDALSQTGADIREATVRFADGSWRDVVCYTAAFASQEDLPGGSVTVMLDITERKQAEKILQEREATLRAITQSAQDAVIMIGAQGQITFWNPAAERIFGYSHAEALGQDLHRMIAPEQFHAAHHQAFAAFQRTGQGAAVGRILELTGRRNSGEEFPVELSMSAVPLDGAWHAVGLVRDVSTRQRVEQERLAMQSQLLQAQKLESVGRLAAGIAHEINTPTQFIGDNTRFFQEGFQDLCRLLADYEQLRQAVANQAATPELVARIQATAEAIDADYLTAEIPKAIGQALEGVDRVANIVRAMKEFSHPGTGKSPRSISTRRSRAPPRWPAMNGNTWPIWCWNWSPRCRR